MDANEFSFDALFENEEFQFYESKELISAFDSKELISAFDELNNVLESFIADETIRSYIWLAASDCTLEAQRASFMQGFCFAVKSIKFLMKI